MKSEGFNSHSKHIVLKHAIKHKNVSLTCKLFGISRTTFYNWYRAYQKNGIAGLQSKEPQKPQMPNKVSSSVEREILDYVAKYPLDGPKRIYYEFKSEGLDLGESGIYNVLKRHNLSQKRQRLEYSKNKTYPISVKKKKRQAIPFGDQAKSVNYPGQCVIQRIDFIGKFDGVGKIYQYSIYDVYSRLGVVKLYNKKQDIDVWYFFEHKIMYLLKTFNISIDYLLTYKTKEFLPYFVKGNMLIEVTDDLNINHRFVEYEENSVLDEMTDFNRFLVKDFYSYVENKNSVNSFSKVEREFQKFLRNYNFLTPISKGVNSGKTPIEVVLEQSNNKGLNYEELPIWILALLNQKKRVDVK
ncbi:helix-turn-helix domain-containing protein [Proteinivorax tanatarense]|uniref:Helix-turn-helix domain-containing protein n=1 Tax=Proteinivorax tanatarense TaxID=1260629 RepID=A0AAU7VK31_9FIRM